MISIEQIRASQNQIIVFGYQEPIIQSILDFDFLSGKKERSISAIVTGKTGFVKMFYGQTEILIPTFTDISSIGSLVKSQVGTAKLGGDALKVNYWFLNLLSGRRTLSSTIDTLKFDFAGGALFAEDVPELHSLQIIHQINRDPEVQTDVNTKLIVGPASVGLLIPGSLKLGPLGGITSDQIIESKITKTGHVAIISASGGMTNELISIASLSGQQLSFALSFGGDRFPILSPREAFLLAEADPQTTTVLYYGELGGEDEYELVKLKQSGLFTKHVIAHIAGTVASLFTESPQFGHAKAKADKLKTTALVKREALRSVGFSVSNSFSEFIELVAKHC